jgi:hypothetical protein
VRRGRVLQDIDVAVPLLDAVERRNKCRPVRDVGREGRRLDTVLRELGDETVELFLVTGTSATAKP